MQKMTSACRARRILLSVFGAVGCTVATAAFAEPAVVYDTAGKFDKSFSEAAYNGAAKWAKETGGKYQDLEIQTDAQREQALRKFAAAGKTPIIVVSFSWQNAVAKVAKQFPKTNFAIVDAVVDLPNVRSIVFDEHTGSFLVGAIAAMKSQTGKVGFVGGMDVPIIHKFFCGFKQGAVAANPKAVVFENYTGTTPNAFRDPVAAGELARADFDRGADVVFAAAGGSGPGVLQAAKDAGKLSIGVDSNQNYMQPGSVLTSMIKRVDLAVYQTLIDGSEGGKWTSGVQRLGLAQDGVGYAIDDYNRPLLDQATLSKVEDLKKKIVAGDINVHDYTTDNACP